MKRPPLEPLFLARQSYRRRRLGDAARLLPIVGAALFLLPILWSSSARTGSGAIYLFAVWAGLIIAVSLISRRLVDSEPEDTPPDHLPPPGPDEG